MKDEILAKKAYESELTTYTSLLRERANDARVDQFAKLRGFSRETVEEAGIFYIQEMGEMLLPAYLDKVNNLGVISETNKKPIFRERWVIPIKTQEGLVQNMVGYSPDANERYIYGTSHYYRRKETMYGLENLEMAYDMGYAFITEGITDTIRLRDMGYKNSFAMCGTHDSTVILQQLNRCRNGVILIPDRDEPGLRAHKQWIFNRSLTIIINFMFKDVDQLCKEGEENQQWFRECADVAIQKILSQTHDGFKCSCETMTMM